jgi:hypothetical protein
VYFKEALNFNEIDSRAPALEMFLFPLEVKHVPCEDNNGEESNNHSQQGVCSVNDFVHPVMKSSHLFHYKCQIKFMSFKKNDLRSRSFKIRS